jgi:membrane protein DedA with SNARE-associated domain/membrane-associated phospholipid phosphatase
VLDHLIASLSRLGQWGYLLIFLGATLEAAAFLGLLVPGESLVVFSGFLASRRLLDVGDLVVIVAAGAILGDSIGYELGRRMGRSWLVRSGRWVGLGAAQLERVDAFFARHGGKTVFLGRFVGFLRALAPFVAGSSRMPYRQFLPYNVLGGILWSLSFVLLGYFFGASWQVAEHWIGRASAIVGGVLLLVIALLWLWRWLTRHEAGIQQHWARFLAHPRIAALRHRFAPLLAFVHARLSPHGYLGLHLTLGALILIGATWLFGAIAEDVVSGDSLTLVDVQVAAWLHARATPRLTTVMLLITRLGSTAVVSGITSLMALFLLWRRQWYGLLALIVTVPGGMVLNGLLKDAFDRARPHFTNPLVTLSSYSFPSGHTMAATVLYGVLAAFAVWTFRAWRWRVLAVLIAVFLLVLVGFSRLYLGAHYLSDVLGAIAEGLAWLALCLTGVETVQRRRRSLQDAAARSAGQRET